MLASLAAGVVVIHHALADAGFPVRHPGADRDDDAAGLVSGDHGFGAALESGGRIARLEARAIDVQVAAAHAGRLDLEHHVARAGRRVGELAQFELPVPGEHDAFHAIPTDVCSTRTSLSRDATLTSHAALAPSPGAAFCLTRASSNGPARIKYNRAHRDSGPPQPR